MVWRKTLPKSLALAFLFAVLFSLDIPFSDGIRWASGGAARPRPDSLAALVTELRCQNRYGEALEVARVLFGEKQRDQAARSWERRDAEILVTTLDSVTRLTQQAQQEMSEADRLTQVVQNLAETLSWEEGIRVGERQLEIRTRYLGDLHPEVGGTLQNLGVLYRDWGRYSEAVKALERALAIRRRAFGQDHPLVAEGLCDLAIALMDRGDFADAGPLCGQALAIYEPVSDPGAPEIARALFASGRFNVEGKGDYHQALAAFEQALAIQEHARTPVHRDMTATLARLAPVYARLGRIAEAEEVAKRAAQLSKETVGTEHPDFAMADRSLAMVEWQKGKCSEAERLFKRALTVEERSLGQDHPVVGRTLSNLASVCLEQGKYDEAEVLYVRSRAVLEQALGSGNAIVAKPLHNLGVLYREQGRYAEAEGLLEQVLAIRELTLGHRNPQVAACLLNLGCLCGRSGNYARADTLLRRALAIFEEIRGPRSHEVAVTLANLAELRYEGGLDLAEAEDMLGQSLDIQNELFGPEQPNSAILLGQMGDACRARGDIADAEGYYLEAIATAEKTLAPQHPVFCSFLDGLATCCLTHNDMASAELALARAASVFETARLRAGGGFARATFQTSPYVRLAAIRLEAGDEEGAWPAAEMALGRALADLLMATDHRSLSQSEAALEDSLKGALHRLEGEMAALRSESRGDSAGESRENLSEARRRLLETEAAWAAFQHRTGEKYPVTEGQAFELSRVQAALTEDMAVVGWLSANMRDEEVVSWGYVVRHSGPVAWTRIGEPGRGGDNHSGSEAIREFRRALTLAASWRERVSGSDIVDSCAAGIWLDWIAPLVAHLEGVENLIVITSGPMLGVPVETLVEHGGTYLGQKYAVSYTPSATVLAWLKEKAESEEGSGLSEALLVGDPPFAPAHLLAMETGEPVGGPNTVILRGFPEVVTLRSALAGSDEVLKRLPRLPWSRREVEEIAGVIPAAEVLLGSRASEQELVRLAQAGHLKEMDILHLATHALVDDEMPERSALALSRIDLPDPLESIRTGGRICDGLISAEEIIRDWELAAGLVTLSGCRTGLGQEIPGEGYIGLTHAFLQAGARSLLVSLWRVEDEATALLMGRFYENLTGAFEDERQGYNSGPIPKAEALQEAKHWLRTYTDETGRQPFRHPVYWSGFILIGAPG